MEKESGFAKIGNANLYYEIAGEGKPLVFLHAGIADSRQWDNEFENFSQDYRVLPYDLRGHGKSVPVEGEFSHLGDLLEILNNQSLAEPITLIGCSMGGTLAMEFALEHPDRMNTLVMVGSGPSGLQLDVPDHPKMAEAEEAYENGDLDRLAELEAQIWFDGMGRTSGEVNSEMRALALEMNRLALANEALALGKRLPDTDPPAAGRLAELKIPILIVVGENDIPYLQAAADYMTENLPSSRKIVLKDAAHLANMDQPAEFQIALRTFLE